MACRTWTMVACAMLLLGCGIPPDTGPPADEGPQPPGPLPFTRHHFGDAGPIHDIQMSALALSPDGARALTGYTARFNENNSDEDPGEYNVAKLWDAAGDGRPLRVLKGFDGGVCMAAFLPDGKSAVLAAGSALRAYDLETGKLLWWAHVCTGRPIEAAAVSPDGRHVLTYGYDAEDGKKVRGRLKLFSATGGKLLRTFDEYDNTDVNILFSPDGKLAGVGNSLLDVDGDEILKPRPHPLAFSPDGRLYVSDQSEGQDAIKGIDRLVLWESRTGKQVRTFDPRKVERGGQRADARAASFSPDGKYVLSGEGDGKLRRWDVASGKELWAADMGRYAGGDFAFSADGRRVLSWTGKEWARGPSDWHLGLWDAADGKLLNGFPPWN